MDICGYSIQSYLHAGRPEKEEKKDELGENRGNKIQEHTKRTRSHMHKGDEEKKPAAKKSNYLVEKNRASSKDGFAPLLLRAPNSQSGSVRASDFPQIFYFLVNYIISVPSVP